VMDRRYAKLVRMGDTLTGKYKAPREERKVIGWDIFTGEPIYE